MYCSSKYNGCPYSLSLTWHTVARSRRRPIATLGFIAQMPRVAMRLQLTNNVIGDRVALGLGQPLLEPTHDFASATKCKGDRVLEPVHTGSLRYENIA
jgi:hypothetical protein